MLTCSWMGVTPIKVAPYPLARGFTTGALSKGPRTHHFLTTSEINRRASLADASRGLRNVTIAGRTTWNSHSLLSLTTHYLFSRSRWANHAGLWLTFSREGSFFNKLKNIRMAQSSCDLLSTECMPWPLNNLRDRRELNPHTPYRFSRFCGPITVINWTSNLYCCGVNGIRTHIYFRKLTAYCVRLYCR